MLHTQESIISGDPADLPFVPDRAWWRMVFDRIDAGDAHGFVNFLTPDAEFRFANAPVVTGRAAIVVAVEGFFAAIGSSRHEFFGIWSGSGTAGCEGEVTYARRDGSVVAYPFANVFQLRAEKIASYHIYIDNSTLFAAA
jgi:ketosteroid isomerase-like protein